MFKRGGRAKWMVRSGRLLVQSAICFALCLLCPLTSQASFIETTIGTAVVNDATSAYYNPAALVLLKNTQLIPLVTAARFQTDFVGQSTPVPTGWMQSGASRSTTRYYSPSFYFGMPVDSSITIGFAAVSNFANRNPEESAILRYVQSSNTIQDYDFVPSIGIKLNDFFSLGVGINYSYTNFHLRPISGFPGSNIADAQSHNQSDGSGIGANAGFLLKATEGTLIGFDYRTVTTYGQSGTSIFNGATQVISHRYHFTMRTPARSIFSISQMLTSKLGFITTVQRIQWNILRNIDVYGIATTLGAIPVVVNANIPYYLHNTWLLTLGGHYRFSPDWIVRVAGTYNQSPENGSYQVSTGNSYVFGGSLEHKLNETITLAASYAHAFIQDASIHTKGNRYQIAGINQGSRDAVSLKLTVNI